MFGDSWACKPSAYDTYFSMDAFSLDAISSASILAFSIAIFSSSTCFWCSLCSSAISFPCWASIKLSSCCRFLECSISFVASSWACILRSQKNKWKRFLHPVKLSATMKPRSPMHVSHSFFKRSLHCPKLIDASNITLLKSLTWKASRMFSEGVRNNWRFWQSVNGSPQSASVSSSLLDHSWLTLSIFFDQSWSDLVRRLDHSFSSSSFCFSTSLTCKVNLRLNMWRTTNYYQEPPRWRCSKLLLVDAHVHVQAFRCIQLFIQPNNACMSYGKFWSCNNQIDNALLNTRGKAHFLECFICNCFVSI